MPKPGVSEQAVVAATMMEDVCKRLNNAFENVAANKGAAGPDRQSIEQVREHWSDLRRQLETELLEETFRPGNIRRAWIPKASGGERPLGIPNVIDRVVQEAVRQVLEPIFEPTFHEANQQAFAQPELRPVRCGERGRAQRDGSVLGVRQTTS